MTLGLLIALQIAILAGIYFSLSLPKRADIVWHVRQYRRGRQNTYTPRHAAHS